MFRVSHSTKMGLVALAAAATTLMLSSHQTHAAPAGKGKDPGLVDCAAGDSISAAIAAGVTEITVNGTCTENVDLRGLTNITIKGANLDGTDGTPLDEITAAVADDVTVRAFGSQNIVLRDLKITGGRNTIVSFGGSQLFMANVESSGGTVFSLFVGDNSWAQARNSSFTSAPVQVTRNGTLRIFESVVDNGSASRALVATDSVVYAWATDFVGNLGVFSNSRVFFGDSFLAVTYSASSVSADSPSSCGSYSNIFAENDLNPNSVLDGSGNPLDVGDFTTGACLLIGIPPAP